MSPTRVSITLLCCLLALSLSTSELIPDPSTNTRSLRKPKKLREEAQDQDTTSPSTIYQDMDRMKERMASMESQLEAMSRRLEHVESMEGTMGESLLLKPNTAEVLPRPTDSPGKKKQVIIERILSGTSGTLYTGFDRKGKGGTFNYALGNLTESSTEGCIRLPRTNFKSVETNNGCIRLFSTDSNCHGPSLAIYPGSSNSPNIRNPNFKQIKSLGPCLSEEFEFSALSNSSDDGVRVTKSRTSAEEIPDEALIGGYRQYNSNSTRIRSSTNPITNYLRDDRNRTLYLEAAIFERHQNESLTEAGARANMMNTEVWRALDKNGGDKPGYVIPPSFGGPGNETYNVFPQSERNENEWNKVLNHMREFVVTGGTSKSNYFHIFVNFAYTDGSNRPFGFYYQGIIHRLLGNNKVLYGFIRN